MLKGSFRINAIYRKLSPIFCFLNGKALGWEGVKKKKKKSEREFLELGTVAQTYDTSTWKAVAGGSSV
jgi:hypothetical protein